MATTQPALACPPCEPGPFTRNHYFTGKLLVERDFTDEQRYYVDKLRHHHRRLHGWGVVCGLRVVPHPNPACRDRFVCIEPGTAVDCCGREIVVAERECIELASFDAVRAILDQPGGGGDEPPPHPLQIRTCYRECPTEDIPVLYDECGCDDTQCAPNRILESFRFEILADQPDPVPPDPPGATLDRVHTLAVARAHRVALGGAPTTDDARVYVLAANAPGGTASLLAFHGTHHALLHTATFLATEEVLDLAVADDGALVFVSLRSTAVGETRPLQVRVLDADLALINTLTIPDNVAGTVVALAASADGRLYALNAGNRRLYAWPTPQTDTAAQRVEVLTGPNGSRLLCAAPDGARVFVASPDDPSVTVFEVAAATSSSLALPAGVRPAALAAGGGAGAERLFVADETGRLRIFGFRPGEPQPFPQLGAGADLGGATAALAASRGGGRVYGLVEVADGHGRVVAVDAHRVETNATDAVGTPAEIEREPRSLALAADGQRLYAAAAGDAAGDGSDGGVAVFDVVEDRCEDIFRRSLDGCPECDDECLILATIRGWRPNAIIEADDIDNWTGRRLLPSTTDIVEVLRCLLDQGGGTGGPGEQGPPGLGIDAVQATFVDCTQPGSAQIQVIGGVRTLVLQIPRGCDGEPAEGGAGIDDVVATFVPCQQPGSATIQVIGGVRTLVLEVPRGCDGATGPAGPGIDAVTATFVPCTTPGSATITTSGTTRTLELTIPRGCDGAPGQDGEGLERDLVRIRALSWRHRGSAQLMPILDVSGAPLRDPRNQQTPLVGLVIGFTDRVRINDGARPFASLFDPNFQPRPFVDWNHVFQVLVARQELEPRPAVLCRCMLFGDVLPVDFTVDPSGELITSATARLDAAGQLAPDAPGAAWVLDQRMTSQDELARLVRELWVALRGDFVLDRRGRAVDAEFVRGTLGGGGGTGRPGTGDHPLGSEFGVQGGLFESWFDLETLG